MDPLIVVAELRAGFANSARQEAHEGVLARFLNSDTVRTVCPDGQTTRFHTSIYAALRRRGTPIPTNDLRIAALVLQHGLLLLRHDSDFDRIPELARVGPV